MKIALILCIFSILVLDKCNGAHILAYVQAPFYSHQIAFRPLWQELAKRGHKLTLLTTNLMETNENITQIDLSEAYKMVEKHDIYNKLALGDSVFKIMASGLDVYTEVTEYELKKVQSLLRNGTKFDLVISELHLVIGIALAEKLGVPSIGIVSMDGHLLAHDIAGNPTHPVANPDYDLAFSQPLSFKERVISTVYSIMIRSLEKFFFIPMQEKLLENYIGKVPSLEETLKNLSMLFINANPIFNDVRPLGPKTINIGGAIHFSKPKPLPQDLQELLDNAHKGLIYCSLGTNIKSDHISNKTKNVILKTFAQLPYQVLWKFDDESSFMEIHSNIKIKKWIPQQDVLRHKNVKLFITHGGLQSMEEAIFNYVPMVGLPFFGDQHNNVNKMVTKGFGLSLDHATLDVEIFKNAILEVINNPRYKEKTKYLAELVLDQPMTGLEKAVWWTEYVIRHGKTKHFRNLSVDLPFYQYYLLDVISFIFTAIFISIFILIRIIPILWRVSSKICSSFVGSKHIKIKTS